MIFIYPSSDGYTVSDVLMYWKPTPVLGVFDAELPQFTILGYETNDRKVFRSLFIKIQQNLSLREKLGSFAVLFEAEVLTQMSLLDWLA